MGVPHGQDGLCKLATPGGKGTAETQEQEGEEGGDHLGAGGLLGTKADKGVPSLLLWLVARDRRGRWK